jgi:hypothetical protein
VTDAIRITTMDYLDVMTTRTRLDLFKRYRNEYVAPKQPRLIQVEPAQYLVIAASDESNGSDTNTQEKALYAVASALRTVTADAHQRDFILGKLERLLSNDDAEAQTHGQPCKVMMRVPGFVTRDDVAHAMAALLARGPDATTAQWVRQAHIGPIDEGLCAQVLHAGPNDVRAQAKTLALLHGFAQAQGFETAAPIHAVYLASSQHVPPEHLRTLLRWPVRTVSVSDQSLAGIITKPDILRAFIVDETL